VRHEPKCPWGDRNSHSDAAKRIYDTYHLHRTADLYGATGKWFACALADGTTDGELYDTKSDCIRHQHHNEQFYAYVQITPANMSKCSAEIFLGITRRLYDAGMRMADPDHREGGHQLITRVSVEDQLAYLRGRSQNIRVSRN
jgi:hypothetical protein